jgi:hypothetical protein
MVDHRMNLRDRAKHVLRMCGHALTVTVHDRLQELERELQATQLELRIAKLVETNTALLEASIHVVENLHALAGRTIVETEPSDVSVEAALMAFLYSHVPSRVAISINSGDQKRAEALLRAGYDVYALEAGQAACPLTIARMNGGMSHAAGASGSTGVSVDTLTASSAGANPLDRPERIALIALGCGALPALRELGDHRAIVITADLESDFEELAREMRSREYHWNIVLYRRQEGNASLGADDGVDHNGDPGVGRNGNGDHTRAGGAMRYYANHSRALPNSRGSVLFFCDYRVFAEAQSWCAATLPRTYFKPRQA